MAYLADQPIETEAAPLRLCTDCKHHEEIGNFLRDVHGCSLEACGSRIDPVDGKRFYKLCAAARREDGACGPTGKLWEDAAGTSDTNGV